jgi:hypothetical protein
VPGSILDLLAAAAGHPDPADAIAARLGQMPGQPGSPQGPQPLAGAVPPAGPPAGPPGGGPGASGPSPGAPPGGAAPAPPQPQATQTPPDLGQMFVQLMQRQQADQGFNRGLGMLAAGFAQPRDRATMIDAMSQPTGGDPGSLMGRLIQLQQWNIEQQNRRDVLQSIPGMADKMGIDPSILLTMAKADPEGFGKTIGSIEMAQAGLTGNITDKEYRQAQKAWGTTPDSQDAQGNPLPRPTWLNTEAGFQVHQQTVEAQGKDVREAAQALPGYNTSLGDMSNRLAGVQAQSDVIKGIIGDPKKQIAAQTLLNAEPNSWSGIIAQNSGVLDTNELKAIGDLKQLKNQNYASNFKSGQRLTQTEAQRLGQAADQISNVAVSPDTYMKNISDVQKKLGHAQANAYGAAEDFDNLPMNLRPLMDPSYLKGGVNARDATPMPAWAIPVNVSDPKDLAALPKGQAYRIKSGPYAGVHYAGFKDDGTPTQ